MLTGWTGLAEAGGGWTLEKNKSWIELSASYLRYDELWNDNETFTQLQRPVTDLGIRLYAEYGLFDQLTLIGQLPVVFVSTSGEPVGSASFPDTLPAGNLNYLGNFRFGARYRLFNRNSTVMSVQLLLESNNSDLDQITGLQTGFNAWSFEPILAFGKSFGRTYIAGHGGIAFRTNQYSEEFLGQLEFGVNPVAAWWVIGVADYRLSFRNGENQPCNTAYTGLYVNNQESFSFGLKTVVPVVKNFGLTAGVYGALSADNLPAAFSLNGGLFWNPDFGAGRRPGSATHGEAQ